MPAKMTEPVIAILVFSPGKSGIKAEAGIFIKMSYSLIVVFKNSAFIHEPDTAFLVFKELRVSKTCNFYFINSLPFIIFQQANAIRCTTPHSSPGIFKERKNGI